MAILNFCLSNPRWFLSAGPNGSWQISYDIRKFRSHHSVALATGGDLLGLSGVLILTGGAVEPNEIKSFGALHYLEAFEGTTDGVLPASPEHFSIECVLPSEQVIGLIEAERSGHGAAFASVTVPRGMDYGNVPDGSHKCWNNTGANASLPVNSLQFGFSKERDDAEQI